MTLRIQTRLFSSHADAVAAAHDLGVAGYPPNEVHLIHSAGSLRVGSGGDGLLGALSGAGLAAHQAQGLAASLREGGTLVVVRTDEARAERSGTTLANHLAVHDAGHMPDNATPDADDVGIHSAPAPGTPGNPPGQ